MKKAYVGVRCQTDTDGNIRPLKIRWADGRVWDVDRVIHTCQSPDCSYSGIRYTVLIDGMEKYVYHEQRRWYVLVQEETQTHENAGFKCRA